MIASNDNQSGPPTDYTTGLRLFDKFQNQWEQLHVRSEDVVSKAKSAVTKLAQLEQRSSRQLAAIDSISHCYKSLTKLDGQIRNIQCDLQLLEASFTKLGQSISILKQHKQREEEERRRRDNIIEIDSDEERKLEERRQVLARAFQEDILRYLEETQLKDSDES